MFRGSKPLTLIVAAAVAGLAAGAASAEAPADGLLDSSFAEGGIKTIAFDTFPSGPLDVALDAVVDSFGRLYLIGTVSTNDGPRIGIVRLRKDGSVETSYGPDDVGLVVAPKETGFGLTGVSAAFDADGNLLVGGTVTTNGNSDFAVCRFNSDGVLTAFPSGFTCRSVGFDLGDDDKDVLRDILVQPDGKIVMVGSASVGVGLVAGAIARLDTNGDLDADPEDGFGNGGKRYFLPEDVDTINLNAVALMRNGRLVVVGDATYGGTTDRDMLVAHINSNGVMDTSFDGDGVRTYAPFGATRNQTLNEVAVIPATGPLLLDQSIVVAGSLETGIGSDLYKGLVAQFAPNGDPATGFNGTGYVTDEPGQDLAFRDLVLEPNGKVVVTGTLKPSASEPTRYYVTRYKPDGTRDTDAFNAPTGWVSLGLVTSLNDVSNTIVLQDNRIVVAGASLISAAPPANLDFSVIGLTRDQIFADGVD
jgi:uncharacterized delta-60 repeat protein